MSCYNELLDIISKNEASLEISQGITLFLQIRENQTIHIFAGGVAYESSITLSFDEFGTNSTVEEFSMRFKHVSFRVLVDKRHTSKYNVSILLCEIDEEIEDEETCDLFSHVTSVSEEIAKTLIQFVLIALDEYIKKHSNNMTLRDFGYTNFSTTVRL